MKFEKWLAAQSIWQTHIGKLGKLYIRLGRPSKFDYNTLIQSNPDKHTIATYMAALQEYFITRDDDFKGKVNSPESMFNLAKAKQRAAAKLLVEATKMHEKNQKVA